MTWSALLFVGVMQPGPDLVYGEAKCYRQLRPPPGPNRLYEQGDAAGTVLLPRSEKSCPGECTSRPHRPYKEANLDFPVADEAYVMSSLRRMAGICVRITHFLVPRGSW